MNGDGTIRWIVMAMRAYEVEDARWIMKRAEGTSTLRARKSFPILIYSASLDPRSDENFADKTGFLRFFSSFSSKSSNMFFATVGISKDSNITGIKSNFCGRGML